MHAGASEGGKEEGGKERGRAGGRKGEHPRSTHSGWCTRAGERCHKTYRFSMMVSTSVTSGFLPLASSPDISPCAAPQTDHRTLPPHPSRTTPEQRTRHPTAARCRARACGRRVPHIAPAAHADEAQLAISGRPRLRALHGWRGRAEIASVQRPAPPCRAAQADGGGKRTARHRRPRAARAARVRGPSPRTRAASRSHREREM